MTKCFTIMEGHHLSYPWEGYNMEILKTTNDIGEAFTFLNGYSRGSKPCAIYQHPSGINPTSIILDEFGTPLSKLVKQLVWKSQNGMTFEDEGIKYAYNRYIKVQDKRKEKRARIFRRR